MPITKIPVQHKFGIISQRQRIELQKRIHTSSSQVTYIPTSPRENPNEISEDFVKEYNAAEYEEKDALNEKAEKMIKRAKRRCGLTTDGEGSHVSLIHAWSELAVLAQCKGRIQESCYEVLATSLNQAPLSEDHVTTLFFLAESVIYWLQTQAIKKNYLRSSEITLTKIGEYVFIRLLYHHFAGNLIGMGEHKLCLYPYIKALKKQKGIYSVYPGVLLSISLMQDIGAVIIGPYTNPEALQQDPLEEIPSIAACIYRSLEVWKRVSSMKNDVKEAVIFLFLASHELSSQKWLDAFVTISILGEAAKKDQLVCNLFQDLARGVTVQVPEDEDMKNLNPVNSTSVFPSHGGDDLNISPDPTCGKSLKSEGSPLSSPKQVKVQTLTPRPSIEEPYVIYGIGGWSWKVVYQYAMKMTEICLYGSSANIRKIGLLGKWENADISSFQVGKSNSCGDSCSLVDLLQFDGVDAQKDKSDTWKIRYAALYGLTLITRYLQDDKHRNGMLSGAWSLVNAIHNCSSTEPSVRDAFNIAKLNMLTPASKGPDGVSSNLWMRIAKSLSQTYSIPERKFIPQTTEVKKPSTANKKSPKIITKPNIKRPTLKQEVLVHTAPTKPVVMPAAERGLLNLQRMVVDQLQKDIAGYEEIGKLNMVVEMEKKRMEEEERQKKIQEKRKEKLIGRPTNGWEAYQIIPPIENPDEKTS